MTIRTPAAETKKAGGNPPAYISVPGTELSIWRFESLFLCILNECIQILFLDPPCTAEFCRPEPSRPDVTQDCLLCHAEDFCCLLHRVKFNLIHHTPLIAQTNLYYIKSIFISNYNLKKAQRSRAMIISVLIPYSEAC